MTPLKWPGDPGYDANVKQMAKIRAEQWPEAWKIDLDDSTIAKLEDCMNEKEDDTVDREKIRQEFIDSFTAMTNEKLLETLKNEIKKQWRGFARMNYLWLLRKELDLRGLNQ